MSAIHLALGLLGGGGSVEVGCFMPQTVRQCLLSAARELHAFKSVGKLFCTRAFLSVRSSQVKCLIPISQRAAKAVRAKTLSVLVVFCGAAPPVFRLPDGLIYVSFHSHSQFDFF